MTKIVFLLIFTISKEKLVAMRLTVSAFCLSVLLLSGCAANKSRRSPSHDTRPADVTIKAAGDIPEYRVRPEGGLSELPEVARPVPVRPDIRFNEYESSHVRLAGIHVLPEGGLSLDLDALRGEFCYPYRGKLISDYGQRGRSSHTGVDIKAVPRDTIRAAFAGVVRMSKNYSGYGNIVVIRHYNGLETVYAHAVRNLVAVNDKIEAGDPIALAGRTGRATTEHLHFEVRAGCEHFDPKLLVDPVAMELRPGMLYVRPMGGRIIAYNNEEDVPKLKKTDGGSNAVYKAAAASDPSVMAAAEASKAQYHTVRSGETLSHIARRYSTTVKKICQLNNLSNPDRIRLGQRLRVK